MFGYAKTEMASRNDTEKLLSIYGDLKLSYGRELQLRCGRKKWYSMAGSGNLDTKGAGQGEKGRDGGGRCHLRARGGQLITSVVEMP